MCKQLRKCLHATMAIAFFWLFLPLAVTDPSWVSSAYADDDDGDDDDGDDDDGDDDDGDDDDGGGGGGGGGGSGDKAVGFQGNNRDQGSFFRRNPLHDQGTRQSAPLRAPVKPATPLLVFAEAEVVSLGLIDEDLSRLVQRGYKVLESHDIHSLGVASTRLEVPEGTGLETARDEIRNLRPDAVTDFNHFFRTETAEPGCIGHHCMQFDLIRVTPNHSARAACGATAVIGIIDTGINPNHETFANSRLEVASGISGELEASGARHGTAVAALLVGDPSGRTPGLLPSARLVAIDTFHKAGVDERSDAFSIVRAMDRLANEGVRIINMSLAGPPSALIEQMVRALSQRGIVIVAAAGNGGPKAAPVYPAAYEQVIAVTAVDRNARVYRRAGRGPHIDFAAPGVRIWTAASVKGARHKTGTSFAAPFVSAAAAMMIALNPDMTSADIVRKLAESTRDLGRKGQDDIYGHGLIQIQGLCG